MSRPPVPPQAPTNVAKSATLEVVFRIAPPVSTAVKVVNGALPWASQPWLVTDNRRPSSRGAHSFSRCPVAVIDEADAAAELGLGLPRAHHDFSLSAYYPVEWASPAFPFIFLVAPAAKAPAYIHDLQITTAETLFVNAARDMKAVMCSEALANCATSLVTIRTFDLPTMDQCMEYRRELTERSATLHKRRALIYCHICQEGDEVRVKEETQFASSKMGLSRKVTRNNIEYYYWVSADRLHNARHLWVNPKDHRHLALLREFMLEGIVENIDRVAEAVLSGISKALAVDGWRVEKAPPRTPSTWLHWPHRRVTNDLGPDPGSPHRKGEHGVEKLAKVRVDDKTGCVTVTIVWPGATDETIALFEGIVAVDNASKGAAILTLQHVDVEKSNQLALCVNLVLCSEDNARRPLAELHVLPPHLKWNDEPLRVEPTSDVLSGAGAGACAATNRAAIAEANANTKPRYHKGIFEVKITGFRVKAAPPMRQPDFGP